MRTKRFATTSGVLLAAVMPLAPSAKGDALTVQQVNQTAVAQDDLNTDREVKPSYGSNRASTTDGDGFAGFGNVDVEQSVGFDNPTRTLSASAQVTASATGPVFGSQDFNASGRASYTVLFHLSGPQDLIFMDSGGESALTGPNSTDIPPGTVFAQAGDYTLAGSELASAVGVAGGLSQNVMRSFNVSLRFVIPGDVNQDGTVGFSDLLALAQHYGHKNAALTDGDFNLDGTVGFADLLLLAQNYGQTSMQPAVLSAVPEPVGLGLLVLVPALVRRSRR